MTFLTIFRQFFLIFSRTVLKEQERYKYMAAGYPPGSRGCDPLFQPAPHIHTRSKKTLSSDRAGLREATEGVVGAVECLMTGEFGSP